MRSMKRVFACVVALGCSVGPAEALAADPPQTFVAHVCSSQNRSRPLAGWTPASPQGGAGIVNTCAPAGQFGLMAVPGYSVNWSIGMSPDVRVAALRVYRNGNIVPPARFEFVAYPEA